MTFKDYIKHLKYVWNIYYDHCCQKLIIKNTSYSSVSTEVQTFGVLVGSSHNNINEDFTAFSKVIAIITIGDIKRKKRVICQ